MLTQVRIYGFKWLSNSLSTLPPYRRYSSAHRHNATEKEDSHHMNHKYTSLHIHSTYTTHSLGACQINIQVRNLRNKSAVCSAPLLLRPFWFPSCVQNKSGNISMTIRSTSVSDKGESSKEFHQQKRDDGIQYNKQAISFRDTIHGPGEFSASNCLCGRATDTCTAFANPYVCGFWRFIPSSGSP